jgi:hypothetical protein
MYPWIVELKEHTASIGHLDKTLFDHLWGTYSILKQQGKPEYLCLAGLFHSVYETEYFKFGNPYTRKEVEELIGTQAEHLVYEFCNIVPRTTKLIERQGNWPDQTYADLLDIEFVNAVEQGYYNDSVKTIEAIRKHLIIRDQNA